MKKLFLSLSLVLACSASTFAQDKSYEDYKIFGTLHNDYLGFGYEKIDAPSSANDLRQKNYDALLQFASSNSYLDSFAQSIADHYISLTDDLGSGKPDIDIEGNQKFKNVYFQKYTDIQREYLDQVLNTSDTTSSEYNQRVSDLMSTLKNDNRLKQEAKEIIYFSAAIGSSSFEYWETNNEKWNSKYNTLGYTPDWKKVVKADIGGAISGGITGAAAGAVIVPGIGAVPGWVVGAVGGALGNSIADCLVDYFW